MKQYAISALVAVLTIIIWDAGDRVFSSIVPDHTIERACVDGREYVIFPTGAVASGKECKYEGFQAHGAH